jgi:hypothetical protein
MNVANTDTTANRARAVFPPTTGQVATQLLGLHVPRQRVAAQLNREGRECSGGLVANLMRKLVPRACQQRA